MEGFEEETQEEDEFKGDEDKEPDPSDRKDVTASNGLIRKALIEEAWPQEGEFSEPMYVVRRVMIHMGMVDPISQRENLFHSK